MENNNVMWKEVKGFPLYEISNTGVVRRRDNKRLCKVNKPVSRGEGRVFLYYAPKKKRTISISTLMRENWRYEWIKDLEEGEEVRECYGYPGYFITDKGRVWSENAYNWLSINKHSKETYYYLVRIGGRGNSTRSLSTLVGRTFLPDWKPGFLICHKNEELPFPQINWKDNLFVGTWSDNNKDTWNKGRNHHPGYLTEEHKQKLRRPKKKK